MIFFLLALKGRAHENKLNHVFSILHLLKKNLTSTILKGAEECGKDMGNGGKHLRLLYFTYVLIFVQLYDTA